MGVKGAGAAKPRGGKRVLESTESGAAANRARHRLIRASAGSGKTFQLANHFLGILHGGASPERILATTFTRKAAGEILERVMLRLADAADDDKKSAELAKQIGCCEGLTAEQTRECLAKLARALHRLRVCTLDSFFAQLAVAFGLELGLPPSWTIVEEIDDAALRRQAIQAVLDKHPEEVTDLMHLLNKGESSQSVTRQIREHVDKLYAIFLETDEAAWKKVPEPPMLSQENLETAIADLESLSFSDGRFTKACLADSARARGEKWKDFLKSGFASAVSGDQTYYKKPIDAGAISAYAKVIAHAKGVLLAQLAGQTAALFTLLSRFHDEYEPVKRRRGAMRFEDVTRAITAGGAGWSDRLEDVARRLDSQVEHLLLDEFQDTSLSQWSAVEPFGRHTIKDASGKRTFFCVGDVKQAIYGWRGGVAEIFTKLKEQFAELTHEPLNESYRSSPVIIDVVNRVFDGVGTNAAVSKNRNGVAAWRGGFETHTTARKTFPGYCELRTAPAAATIWEQPEKTLVFAADEIKRLAEAAPGRSIAALVRDNKAVGRLIFELRKRKIEASEEGGNPLIDSPAVTAVLSALALADHPGDLAARFHLAHSPMGRVLKFNDFTAPQAAQSVSHSIRERLLADGYGPTLHAWARLLAPECDARDLDRLTQLARLAYRYDEDATLRTIDFVNFVRTQKVEDPTSAAVRVMTLHQSKGLQFDCVVLPQLDKRLNGQTPTVVVGRPEPAAPIDRVSCYAFQALCGLEPWLRELHDGHIEREAREAMSVLYVGMTRAVHALHMIVAPSGGPEKNGPPETMAGILRCALVGPAPIAPDTVLFKSGDPDWQESADKPAEVARAEVGTSPKVKFARSEEARSRRLKRAAPSGLEGGERVDLKSILRLDSGALSEGTLMHEWFEQVEWLDDGAAVVPPAGASRDPASHARFEGLIANPATRAALSRGTYSSPAVDARPSAVNAPEGVIPDRLKWTVHRERAFTIREENTLLGGKIDRLVVLRDGGKVIGAEVIDYKTDAVAEDAAIAERVEYYRPQIEAYRRAVARLFSLNDDQVTAALIFVTPGVVRAVEREQGIGNRE